MIDSNNKIFQNQDIKFGSVTLKNKNDNSDYINEKK
jgi:hypothetical protein